MLACKSKLIYEMLYETMLDNFRFFLFISLLKLYVFNKSAEKKNKNSENSGISILLDKD